MTEFTAIDDLLAAIDHKRHAIEIEGHKVQVRPPTVLEILRLVKRFPALRGLFEKKRDRDGRALPADMQPTLYSVIIDAGNDAVAAFVACGFDREGDENFEKKFAGRPDDVTIPLFMRLVKITLGGGNIGDFFIKIQMELVKAGVLEVISEDDTAKDAVAA